MIIVLTTRNNHCFSVITEILSHFITLCILKQQMPFLFSKVGQKRWKVETFSRLDSVLLLSSVNLPGGELVRQTLNISPVQRLHFVFLSRQKLGHFGVLGHLPFTQTIWLKIEPYWKKNVLQSIPKSAEETNKIASLETPTRIFQNILEWNIMEQCKAFYVAIEFSGWKAPLVTCGFQEYTFQQSLTEGVFINLVMLYYRNTVLYVIFVIM